MPTWQDEFIRLSELHPHEVERWLEVALNANLVINAGEAEKDFMRQWLSAGEPNGLTATQSGHRSHHFVNAGFRGNSLISRID